MQHLHTYCGAVPLGLCWLRWVGGTVFSLDCYFFFLAECRFYGVCWLCNMADFFPNVTPVALSFCPLPASILQSASLWVETPSSGRRTSPPLRWRWPDCSLHPVENTHYKLNMLKLASIDLVHSSLHQGCNQLLLSPSLRIVVMINRLCFGV